MTGPRWAFVIEDEARSLRSIAALLSDLGIRYKRNTTGAGAVPQIQRMEPKPDFILLDVDLPAGNPLEILRKLKSDIDTADIPVIAIADEQTTGMEPAMRNAGFDAFIAKPLPRRHFGELIERVLAGEHIW